MSVYICYYFWFFWYSFYFASNPYILSSMKNTFTAYRMLIWQVNIFQYIEDIPLSS